MLRQLRFICLFMMTAMSSCAQKQDQISISKADSTKLDLYDQKAIFYKQKDVDSALSNADKGLDLARKLGYPSAEALMLSRLAEINGLNGNPTAASKYQQQALKIYLMLRDSSRITSATSDLGMIEGRTKENPSGAMDLLQTALNQYQYRKDSIGIARTYRRMGAVSDFNQRHKKALQYYQKAEELNRTNKPTDEYYNLLGNIGRLQARTGAPDAAVAWLEKGIAKSLQSGHSKAMIKLLNHAGGLLDTLGEKKKALEYHNNAFQNAKLLGLPEEQARSLIGIARVLKTENSGQSITHLKNALSISRGIGHTRLTAEIYHSLAEVYKQQQRFDLALSALEEHHRLLDSLLESDKNTKIKVLQKDYELAESRIHIENLQLANIERTYERNVSMVIAISLLIILTLLTWYYFRIRKLNRDLRESNQIKDRLFTIIGHDLRNPIGSITSLLALMEEDELTPDEQRMMITEMRKQGNTSLEILNSLLNWGKAQLNGIEVKMENFKASTIIDRNITALQGQIHDKQVVIENSISPLLGICGDADHFDFIVRNLISNAVKFSYPGGKIKVSADTSSQPGQVIFSVSDTGKGISPAQQQQFKTENIAISFGTGGEKGTGIGLMLSKEFQKAAGQEIWLYSEEERGAAFYFNVKNQDQSQVL